uniref:Uncharacterized protein n=1 Tax=Trichuris muris TaxID=70415 RepID=A0A5S6QER8_TRIMR
MLYAIKRCKVVRTFNCYLVKKLRYGRFEDERGSSRTLAEVGANQLSKETEVKTACRRQIALRHLAKLEDRTLQRLKAEVDVITKTVKEMLQ